MDLHVFPILIPPPTSLPRYFLFKEHFDRGNIEVEFLEDTLRGRTVLLFVLFDGQ